MWKFQIFTKIDAVIQYLNYLAPIEATSAKIIETSIQNYLLIYKEYTYRGPTKKKQVRRNMSRMHKH